MKKIGLCVLVFVILCFLLPVVFTKPFQIAEASGQNTEKEENIIEGQTEQEYDYKQYNTIQLLHASTAEVEELPLDTYLYGVVSSEMPVSFEKEALKAQAVVARTYTIYKIQNNSQKHEGADICDSSACCQEWISKEDRLAKWEESTREEYWNKIVTAVEETKGKIITYEGKPINAFFHANSGGKTETTLNVWGGSGYPYLQTVATTGEEGYTQYQSEVICTKQEFTDKIKEKHSDFTIDFSQANCIQVLEYTDGDRVKTIQIGNLSLSGVEIRTIFGLKSANFTITIEGDNIKFSVLGYGHGVGMSQTGADSMAKAGSDYVEIIKHFYTGVEVEDVS